MTFRGYTCITLIFIGSTTRREWIEAGFRENFNGRNVSLVEWPEKAAGPAAAARTWRSPSTVQRLRDAARAASPTRRAGSDASRSSPRVIPSRLPILTVAFLAGVLLAACPVARGADDARLARVARAGIHARHARIRAGRCGHQFFFVKIPTASWSTSRASTSTTELKALPEKVGADDPYIKAVRVARQPSRTWCASCSTCKTEVKPSVFPLAPAGEYEHRLVLDIYPAEAPRSAAGARAAAARSDRARSRRRRLPRRRAAGAAPVAKLDPSGGRRPRARRPREAAAQEPKPAPAPRTQGRRRSTAW